MSRNFPGNQIEPAFLSHRLQNWEVPAVEKQQKVSSDTRFGTLQQQSGRTDFIVDEKGHLLPGVAKINNAFTTKVKVFEKSPARWPKPNPAIPNNVHATMGYKGISTGYLPTSTVTIKAVEVPGVEEVNYNFR